MTINSVVNRSQHTHTHTHTHIQYDFYRMYLPYKLTIQRKPIYSISPIYCRKSEKWLKQFVSKLSSKLPTAVISCVGASAAHLAAAHRIWLVPSGWPNLVGIIRFINSQSTSALSARLAITHVTCVYRWVTRWHKAHVWHAIGRSVFLFPTIKLVTHRQS